MVGGEEWRGVARKGEENFVEHGGLGSSLVVSVASFSRVGWGFYGVLCSFRSLTLVAMS